MTINQCSIFLFLNSNCKTLFNSNYKILLLYLLLKKRKYKVSCVLCLFKKGNIEFIFCFYSCCLKKENKKCVRYLNLLYYSRLAQLILCIYRDCSVQKGLGYS